MCDFMYIPSPHLFNATMLTTGKGKPVYPVSQIQHLAKINFTSCRSHILCTNLRTCFDNYWQLSTLHFLPLSILYRWIEYFEMQVHSWIDVCCVHWKNFLHPLQGKLHNRPPIRNFPVQCQLKFHGGTTPTQRPVFANPSIPTQCIQ